jgi:hypothetical protein
LDVYIIFVPAANGKRPPLRPSNRYKETGKLIITEKCVSEKDIIIKNHVLGT